MSEKKWEELWRVGEVVEGMAPAPLPPDVFSDSQLFAFPP